MSKRNWIDSAVGFVNPEAGFKRAQFRRALEVQRSYEGASIGRRTDGWRTTSGGSANREIGPAISRVRERVRDLVRNNGYAGKAVSVIEGNIVGAGILGSVSIPGSIKQSDILKSLWLEWCDSLDCGSDGTLNFYGLQALASRAVGEAGEALYVRKWRRMSDGYNIPVPFQIQLLEGDYIDTAKEGSLSNGNFVVQGIEFNQRGQRVAYWLFNQHPGERIFNTRKSLTSERYDAKDVRHVYRVDRIGQVRGISWGAPCVVRLHDLDAYEDAQLLRQRIAACFAGFIRDVDGSGSAADPEEVETPERIEAGGIEILPAGKTIEFPNLPQVSNDGHSERVLRSIAAGWGVTYESLTGDLSQINFSSGRMGWLEFQRNVSKWQWNMFIPRFCNPTFQWFLEAAAIQGYQTEGARVVWTPPKREMIDPTREIPAQIRQIRGGTKSLIEAIREEGLDPEEHIKEIATSNELLDKYGLILDSDPRHVMQTGTVQPDYSGSNGSNGSGSAD